MREKKRKRKTSNFAKATNKYLLRAARSGTSCRGGKQKKKRTKPGTAAEPQFLNLESRLRKPEKDERTNEIFR
jgi:hypothetical protein